MCVNIDTYTLLNLYLVCGQVQDEEEDEETTSLRCYTGLPAATRLGPGPAAQGVKRGANHKKARPRADTVVRKTSWQLAQAQLASVQSAVQAWMVGAGIIALWVLVKLHGAVQRLGWFPTFLRSGQYAEGNSAAQNDRRSMREAEEEEERKKRSILLKKFAPDATAGVGGFTHAAGPSRGGYSGWTTGSADGHLMQHGVAFDTSGRENDEQD